MARSSPTSKVHHLVMNKSRGNYYAQLRLETHKITLGRCDRLNPAGLLDVILEALPKLTITELYGLQAADKSMREPDRKSGRPRKQPRI
jgi:hypothetical protein